MRAVRLPRPTSRTLRAGPAHQQTEQYRVAFGGQGVDRMAIDLLQDAGDDRLRELGGEFGAAEIRPEGPAIRGMRWFMKY